MRRDKHCRQSVMIVELLQVEQAGVQKLQIDLGEGLYLYH